MAAQQEVTKFQFPTEAEITHSLPDQLKKFHHHIVVLPYSENLNVHKAIEDKTIEPRLSMFSSIAAKTAADHVLDPDLYQEEKSRGERQKIILCGETTFGEEIKTTNDLMRDYFIRRGIPAEDVISVTAENLNNTAFQIEAVAKWQKEHGFDDKENPFLVLDWHFHDRRVKNNIFGYGLRAETIDVETLHKYYEPDFNPLPLQEALDAFEGREKKLRWESFLDPKSWALRFITKRLGRGGSVTDAHAVRDALGVRHLKLEDTTGKKKLAEIQAIADRRNPEFISPLTAEVARQKFGESIHHQEQNVIDLAKKRQEKQQQAQTEPQEQAA